MYLNVKLEVGICLRTPPCPELRYKYNAKITLRSCCLTELRPKVKRKLRFKQEKCSKKLTIMFIVYDS